MHVLMPGFYAWYPLYTLTLLTLPNVELLLTSKIWRLPIAPYAMNVLYKRSFQKLQRVSTMLWQSPRKLQVSTFCVSCWKLICFAIHLCTDWFIRWTYQISNSPAQSLRSKWTLRNRSGPLQSHCLSSACHSPIQPASAQDNDKMTKTSHTTFKNRNYRGTKNRFSERSMRLVVKFCNHLYSS